MEKIIKNHTYSTFISYALLLVAGVTLIGLQIKPVGWIILLASILSLSYIPKHIGKDLLLINISLSILGITPINTDISYGHMTITAVLLSLAVIVPYLISKYLYKNDDILFTWGTPKTWNKKQYFYLVIAALCAYLIIPFYLVNTGAYINWPSEANLGSLLRLFIGTNGLGIWDELFFVVIVLSLLRKHVSFFTANIFQAILWSSFLYELGFIGWGPILIFIFALLQGYIFVKTHSLIYIICIHLTVDFILFLALVNAHNPGYFNIFIG